MKLADEELFIAIEKLHQSALTNEEATLSMDEVYALYDELPIPLRLAAFAWKHQLDKDETDVTTDR